MTSPEMIREQAEYFLQNKSTLRKTAAQFETSKTTLHKNFRVYLKEIDESLYFEVKALLQENRESAPLRGGLALKKKFEAAKKK